MKKLATSFLFVATLSLTGCFATGKQTAGTLGGGALGAIVGDHIGGTTGALIGGAAGAYAGSELTKPQERPVIVNKHYHNYKPKREYREYREYR